MQCTTSTSPPQRRLLFFKLLLLSRFSSLSHLPQARLDLPHIFIIQASSARKMLPRTPLALPLLAALAVLLQPLPGQAANPKISHPHNGVLEVKRQRGQEMRPPRGGVVVADGLDTRMNFDMYPFSQTYTNRNTSSRSPRLTLTAMPCPSSKRVSRSRSRFRQRANRGEGALSSRTCMPHPPW